MGGGVTIGRSTMFVCARVCADSPYMAPVIGEQNDPINVIGSCEAIATARGQSVETVASQIAENFDSCVSYASAFRQPVT